MSNEKEVSINEIQQLMGRNLITFQSIEILLLDIHLKKSGRGNEKDLIEKRKKLEKMSFGDLTNSKAIDKFNTNNDHANESFEKEVIIDFNFLGDEEYFNVLLKKLSRYCVARNHLVHKFQLNFNLKDNQDKVSAKKLLNQQYTELEPLKEELREISKGLTTRRKEFLEFINSDAFFEEIEKEINN